LKAVERLQLVGFHVMGVLTVVDREEGARAAVEAKGLRFFSLYSLNEIRSES